MMRPHVCMVAFLAALAVASTACAAEPGVVVVKSGNRMTGSVTELHRGELTFSIEGAGSVTIDWHNVVSLKSDQNLDTELASGERFSGTISSPPDGKLEIKTSAGPKVVDMKDVVRIKPIKATLLERTSGSIDGGFAFLHANDEVHRWYVLGTFHVEQDQLLDLDLRILAGGALGRTLVQNNRTVLSLHGGFDYNGEQYSGVPGTSHTGEALAAVEWDLFGAEKTELKTTATSYFGLERARPP